MYNEEIIHKTAAGILAVLIASMNFVPTYAANSSLTSDDIVITIHKFNILEDGYLKAGKQVPDMNKRMPEVNVSDLPSKVDLRDYNGKNYVSPVKSQVLWSICWSFDSIAAAETNIAYDSGHDYNNETDEAEARLFDLSEKHLAWFSYTPLPDNNEAYPSQGGEGLHVILPEGASPNTISEKTYNIGGVCNYASTIFSAGMGPVLEKEAPYQKTKEEEYNLISLVTVEVKEDGKYNM